MSYAPALLLLLAAQRWEGGMDGSMRPAGWLARPCSLLSECMCGCMAREIDQIGLGWHTTGAAGRTLEVRWRVIQLSRAIPSRVDRGKQRSAAHAAGAQPPNPILISTVDRWTKSNAGWLLGCWRAALADACNRIRPIIGRRSRLHRLQPLSHLFHASKQQACFHMHTK